jgi:hypothetical protein
MPTSRSAAALAGFAYILTLNCSVFAQQPRSTVKLPQLPRAGGVKE